MSDTPQIIDIDALKYILGIPQGRNAIRSILAADGLFHQPARFGDVQATYFNCGRLNSGLVLYNACLEASPDLTAMMMKEQGNDNREQRHDARVTTAAARAEGSGAAVTDLGDDSGEPDVFYGLGR